MSTNTEKYIIDFLRSINERLIREEENKIKRDEELKQHIEAQTKELRSLIKDVYHNLREK